MRTLHLKTELPDEEVDALASTFLDETHYDVLFQEDVDVFKPDGEPLLHFRKGAVSEASCTSAYPVIAGAATATPTNNRGMAAGRITDEVVKEIAEYDRRILLSRTSIRGSTYQPERLSGGVSETGYGLRVNSGLLGFMDRYARIPYCRTTVYTMQHMAAFKAAFPYLREVSRLFSEISPKRFKAQKKFVEKSSKDFIIPGTVFTTITCNKNFRTAVHKDAGDLKQGFGVMSAFSSGTYDGCFFVFPKYRVAVDMRTADLLLADVHEWHGNTAFKGKKGFYERVSCVFYCREGIHECGTQEEERKRALQIADDRMLKGMDAE